MYPKITECAPVHSRGQTISELRDDVPEFRPYRTRYGAFWLAINWKLPDQVLADIWQVDRGNIRARRVRLRKGTPRWRQRRDHGHPVFLAAIALEKLKSKKFTGPRPAGPYTTTKGTEMSIPTEISLEILSHNDEGVPSFRLGIELLDANRIGVSATIEPVENMQNPHVSAVDDEIGLQDQDRQMLLLAAYEKMVRYHGTGSIGTIVYSRWVMPDLSVWVRRLAYQPVAGRILRAMRKVHPAGTSASPIKEFTESVEA
jgi:hypothetical protein